MNGLTRLTRRASYEAVKPKVSARSGLILDILGAREMTVNEIADELIERGVLPYYNRNFVAPRMTELKYSRIVEPCGRRKSTRSGKTEVVWRRRKENSGEIDTAGD